MDQPMQDAPADVLADARRTLTALKSSGLSREVLLEMWEAGDRSSTSSSDTIMDDSSARTATSTALSSPSTPVTAFPPPPPPSGAIHPQFGHRPRISVSSTSSGSSGHASIWSMGSMNSTASVSTHYSQSCMNPSPNSQGVPAHSIGVPGNMNQQVASAQTGWGPGRFNYYWCTSCETRFKRKYDWKRHEEEFHERWKKYPCPEPGCNRSFWGANTFNQHHKSSHGCKTCPHSEKVVKYLKRRKYWACGFCSALHPSRERHVEHVARHFESGKTKTEWMHSRVIYGLLHQPQIHEAWKDILMGKAAEFAGRQPNFSWNPTQTGRAQGFMENECPGQLQDLLEFFSGPDSEADSIVALAYELADLVFITSPTSPPMDYARQSFPPPPTLAPPPPPPQALQQQQQHHTQVHQHQPQQQQQQHHLQQQPQQHQAYPPQPQLPPPAIPSPGIPTQQPSPVLPSHQGSSPQSYVDSISAQHSPIEHSPMEMDHIAHQQMHQQHHLMPPPVFHTPAHSRASPDPMMSRSPLDRDLPPPPQEAQPMNFNYMPTAPMVFENWDTFGSTVVQEHTPAHTPVSTAWPMMPVQYYHAPVGQQ